MDSKNVIPITKARKDIYKIADKVQSPGVYYTLTEKGLPKAVLLSVDEFESLIETLEVLEMFPDIENDLERAKEEVERGIFRESISLDRAMTELGYVSDKRVKYGLRRKTEGKSAKRSKKDTRKR